MLTFGNYTVKANAKLETVHYFQLNNYHYG